MPSPINTAWLIVIAVELAVLLYAMRIFGRKLNSMTATVTTSQDQFGQILTLYIQSNQDLAASAEALVKATQEHPAAPDFTAFAKQVSDALTVTAKTKEDIDAVLYPAPVDPTPDPTPGQTPDPSPADPAPTDPGSTGS